MTANDDPAVTADSRHLRQKEFIARGLAARDEADRTGKYYSAAEVHAEIRDNLIRKAKQSRHPARQ